MISVEEFIAQFHSISTDIPEKRRRLNSLTESDTPEKRRRFNTFIIQLKSIPIVPNELSNLVLSITPKDAIEESFRFDIMIKFNLHDTIITEFKRNSNNTLLIMKLIKNYKIFEDLFCNIDGQFFVDDILPNLSYALKLKLLNGISKFMKNENLANEYFLKIENKYGLKLAMNLLPACTPELIRVKMDRYFVTLSNRQLIDICKKDKEFLDYYLNKSPKVKENLRHFCYVHAKAIKQFAKLHPEMLWKVNKEHDLDVKIGRRMISTMFRHRCEILEEGPKFLNYFSHFSELYKTAKKDGVIKEFLFSLFPVTHDLIKSYFWHSILRFVEHLPIADQYPVVSSTFQEKYGLNLLDYPEHCKEFLQIIPYGPRESILDTLIENDDQLIQFYRVEKSIPLIKEKLQHCGDAQERGKLMGLICKTCIVNKDKEAVSEVLSYVLIRHKNDITALTVFFNNLMQFPGIAKLDHVCWKNIADLSKIFEISRRDYNCNTFDNKYFQYLVRNKLSLEEYCKKRLENMMNTYSYVCAHAFSILSRNKHEKMFLEEIGKYIDLYKAYKNYRVIRLSFLAKIFMFNIANKRHRIEFKNYSTFFDSKLFETADEYFCQNLIKNGMKLYPSDEIWHDLFWKRSTLRRNNIVLAWYVQKWPQKVTDNLDDILNNLSIESVDIFLMKAGKFLNENAIETMKAYAQTLLFNNDYKKAKLAITIFSIISPKTLLDIISPIFEKFESNLKLPVTELLLAKLAIKRLHKVGCPHDTLQLIVRYCKRNFALSAVIPLCSVVYSTPEIILLDELPKFTNNTLCIKKTVLSLSKLILSSTDFAKIIQIFNEEETDASMKRIMLLRAFECLNENPSEFFWNFTANCILTMDVNDTDMYDLLMKLTNVPEQYLSAYIPLIFEQLSKNPHLEIQKRKYKLLESIPTQSIKDLKLEFLMKIIKETATLKNTSNLHWNCVLSKEERQQEELFEENFKALQHFADNHGHNLNKNYDISIVISHYISRYLDVVLNSKCSYRLIQKFIALWDSKMKVYSCHHSYLLLLFAEVYAKSDSDAYKTGIEIRTLLKQYIENFGFSIISLLSTQLNEFCAKTEIKKQDQLLRFVQGLLESNEDEDIYVLVVNMISKNTAKTHALSDYNVILQTMQKSTTTVVKIHLDNFIEEIGKNYNPINY